MNVSADALRLGIPLQISPVSEEGHREKYRLTFIFGSLTFSRELQFGEKILIGRASGTKIEVHRDSVFLPNKVISRVHAIVVFDESGLHVCDVGTDGKGSRNGTFVNGIRVNPRACTRLDGNDRVFLGDQLFRQEILVSKVA